MAIENRITPSGGDEHRVPATTTTARPVSGIESEPPLGELFKQLAQDSATLIKQEMRLARAEMQDSIRTITRGAMMLAIGGGLLLIGLLALTAFLIVLLGQALLNYWLGALIVGLVYAVIGGILVMSGKNRLQEADLKPERTIQSLQEDKRWAQAEAQQVKRDMTS
ncbi:phage holin family protein [soil metagenome]